MNKIHPNVWNERNNFIFLCPGLEQMFYPVVNGITLSPDNLIQPSSTVYSKKLFIIRFYSTLTRKYV
jgi:hypothetical protein